MSRLVPAARRLPALLALALVAGLLLLLPTRPAAAQDVTDGLVLRYDLTQASGTNVVDSSGHGRDGTLVGGGTWGDGALTLDGVDDHVRLPDDVLAGLDSVTVHVDVYVEPTQATPFFLWGLGNTATSAAGTGYLFASGNTFRAGITPTNWSGEKVTARTSGGNLERGVWKSVTYTQTGTTGTLFEDGAQVGQNTAVTVTPGDIGAGTTVRNVLGESSYASDNSLKGKVRNFRIYDRALTSTEVADIALPEESPDDTDQAKADAAAAAIRLVHPDDVRGHLTLPATGTGGATITWASEDETVVATDGIVQRPAHGAGDASVTLTATVTVGTAQATRAIELTVREKPAPAPYAGYAFSYFTGNSIAGEKIYFAASRGNNALKWDELNEGKPVLESTQGEMGLRDPFLIRSPEGDRFYLIATDLSIGRNGDWDRSQRTGSRYLEVWESTDLKTWSEQRHVLVSPPTAGNTWAPEAYWDEDLQQFVVFWASKLYAEDDPNHTGSTYNRMLYATTRDFVTFSPAKIWQDRGESRIDSTVIREDGHYYRFTKDEGGGGTGCSDIIQETADQLTAVDLPGDPAWTMQDSCIGKKAGTSAVEGPTVFEANPGDTSGSAYYLFVDEYGGRGYIPLGTDDLDQPSWRVPAVFDLPASPRHGTVIPVTQAELDRLRAGIVLPEPPTPVEADENGLVAHYELDETTGATAADSSGHGYDATVSGDATWSEADSGLSLGGTNGHVRLPDDMMAGLDAITVSTEVWVDPTQATPYFIWGLGNTDGGGTGNGYLFTTGNSAYRTSIASANWTTEQTVSGSAALPRWNGARMPLSNTLADAVVRELAADAATAFIPQCGLAPGFITIAAWDLIKHFDQLHDVRLRVGALPRYPSNALNYNLTWSTDGLINEYIEPCEAIVEGALVTVPALEEREEFSLDGVTYEAFNTSGGLGTLAKTLEGRVRTMNYRTIRYPGHYGIIKALLHDLNLKHRRDVLKDLFENALPTTMQDMVVIFVTGCGWKDGRYLQETYANKIYAGPVAGRLMSAIQITTAAGITAILDMLAEGELKASGFVRQEDITLGKFLCNRFGRVYRAAAARANAA